jgi:hypothetical protein
VAMGMCKHMPPCNLTLTAAGCCRLYASERHGSHVLCQPTRITPLHLHSQRLGSGQTLVTSTLTSGTPRTL